MTSSQPVQKTASNRFPAPALFVGPPSRNASNTSLAPGSQTNPPTNRLPLSRQRSHLSNAIDLPSPLTSKRLQPVPSSNHLEPLSQTSTNNPLSLTTSNALSLAPTSSNPLITSSTPFSRRAQAASASANAEATSRAEAVWAETQNKLREVELTGLESVFAERHERALEELRAAQIELARAWARGEGEEEKEEAARKGDGPGGKRGGGPADDVDGEGMGVVGKGDLLAVERAQKLGIGGEGDGARRESAATGGGFDRSRLEEETERDIELSRKRREANDRYFERVNKGVLEVVMKLEEVAAAMKGVELESKEIWRDEESIETGSTRSTRSRA